MANIYPFYLHLLKCEASVAFSMITNKTPAAVVEALGRINQRLNDNTLQDYCLDLGTIIRYALVKGASNHKADKGGLTIAGITEKTWKKYVNEHSPKLYGMTFPEITPALWMSIIKEYYWDALGGDNIKEQETAEQTVDFYFHSGVSAVKKIQQICGVKVDGIIGPVTRSKLEIVDKDYFVPRIKRARVDFLFNLAAQPGQMVFLKGWINRLVDW